MTYKIYIIKNLINNKVYVGQTYKPIIKRFKEHLTSIHRNTAGCRKLVNAIKKHGKSNFYVELLACTENDKSVSELESFFIKYFDSIDSGYNLLDSGNQFRHSQETIKLISNSMKGKYLGSKNPFYGKIHSAESRKKISDANMGRVGCMTGKQHTTESKNKISEGHRGDKNVNVILTEEDVKYIKLYVLNGGKQIDMVKKYNVHKSTINNIVKGRAWSYVKI